MRRRKKWGLQDRRWCGEAISPHGDMGRGVKRSGDNVREMKGRREGEGSGDLEDGRWSGGSISPHGDMG